MDSRSENNIKGERMRERNREERKNELRKQAYGYQGGKGGINWEIGIDMYTLLYIKQITNKDLLYSTGN